MSDGVGDASGKLKPTLFICVELKSRELDAQALLAAEAALRGFRVYLGSHGAIHRLLKSKKNRAGVYLDKSTQPEWILGWIDKKCQYITIIDFELTPIIDRQLMTTVLPNRIYPNSNKYVSKFFCAGPIVHEEAERHFGEGIAIPSSWPKIDIWQEQGSAIYRHEINEIQNRLGQFLLFVSGFRYLENPILKGRYKSPGHIIFNEKNTLEYKLRNYQNFLETLRIFDKWDSIESIGKIVVRPHPSEDARIWGKALKDYQNFSVEVAHDATPWILASNGVIHAGSTVSLEAKLGGKPLFYIRGVSLQERHAVSDQLSEYEVGFNSPPSIIEGTQKSNPKYQPEILSEMVYLNKSGTTEVLNEITALNVNPELEVSKIQILRSRLMAGGVRRFVGLVRDELYWKLRITNMPPQSQSIKGGINPNALSHILNSNQRLKGVVARRVILNLVLLEN